MDKPITSSPVQKTAEAHASQSISGRERRVIGLSVIVNFHNMRREAERTLYSLTRYYQNIPASEPYEVIALDNGSTAPLNPETVLSFGSEFAYQYVESKHPSPCAALNRAVEEARHDNVMILIDGARMLSPGILSLTAWALQTFEHPFIYTIGMHLGAKTQNYLVTEGWNAASEDELLASVDWQRDGYSLFGISSMGLSSKRGFFSRLSESNCFIVRKEDFLRIGSYQSQFRSPGGGLCNLEFFNRVNQTDWMQPVLLLGEASFHQMHGGVATNAPADAHPWDAMAREYAQVVGEPWRNKFRSPLYFGPFREQCAHLYDGTGRKEDERAGL